MLITSTLERLKEEDESSRPASKTLPQAKQNKVRQLRQRVAVTQARRNMETMDYSIIQIILKVAVEVTFMAKKKKKKACS
jgi:hypothetical protein